MTDHDIDNLDHLYPTLSVVKCCARAVQYRSESVNMCARDVPYRFHAADITLSTVDLPDRVDHGSSFPKRCRWSNTDDRQCTVNTVLVLIYI